MHQRELSERFLWTCFECAFPSGLLEKQINFEFTLIDRVVSLIEYFPNEIATCVKRLLPLTLTLEGLPLVNEVLADLESEPQRELQFTHCGSSFNVRDPSVVAG